MNNSKKFSALKIVFIIALIISTIKFIKNKKINSNNNNNNSTANSTEKNKNIGVLTKSFNVMGTFARLKLFGTKEETEKAAKIVINQFNLINKHLNTFNKNSELSHLNATAFEKTFKCSPLLWDILKKCQTAYIISDGSFDVTAKPLMNLWGFYRKRPTPTLPTKKEIKDVLTKVGFNKIILNNKEKSVKFTVQGMAIDLGGIAKGFAVDLAVEKLLEQQIIKGGIINLGGNLRILPQTNTCLNKNELIKIGITNPFKSRKTCGFIKLTNNSVATSGDYERFVTINDKRYGHIMNPKTGKPVENIYGVTIITPSATDADWISTTIFINGEKSAQKIINNYPNTAILIIKEDQKGKIIVKKYSNLVDKNIWNNIKKNELYREKTD